MIRRNRNTMRRLGSWSPSGPRLVADHRLHPARRDLDAPGLRVAQAAQPGSSLPAAVRVPAPGDAEDHAHRGAARDPAARGGRPRRDASHPPDRLQAGGRGRRRDPARADRRVPRGGRAHAAVPRGAPARAPPRPRPRTPSSRSPTPTSPAIRSGSARSVRATTSMHPAGRRPPRPSPHARRHSPGSRAKRCPRSSTSPRSTAGPDCAPSRGATTDAPDVRRSLAVIVEFRGAWLRRGFRPGRGSRMGCCALGSSARGYATDAGAVTSRRDHGVAKSSEARG